MMEYVLVALLSTSPGNYSVEVVQDFKTLPECSKVLQEKVWTMKNMQSLICAKKDWD